MSKKCHSCKNESDGKFYCEPCNTKNNERNQKKRTDRLNAGLCTNCGGEKDTGWRMCSKCQAQNSNGARQRNKEKLAEGKCNIYNCENPKLIKSRFCETHRIESLTRQKKRCLKLIDEGLCTCCATEKYMDHYTNRSNTITKHCQTCYLKQLSASHLGTMNRWKELFDILVKQNFTCPYTGDKLTLGFNDSIDHVLPRSLYPEKKRDINNLRWVTRTINNMKYDSLDKEFCEEIVKIVRHLGADLYKNLIGPQV